MAPGRAQLRAGAAAAGAAAEDLSAAVVAAEDDGPSAVRPRKRRRAVTASGTTNSGVDGDSSVLGSAAGAGVGGVGSAEGLTRVKRRRRRAVAGAAGGSGDGHCHRSDQSAGNGVASSFLRSTTSFAKLGLARWLTESCQKLGMVYPTEIQAMCIPPVLAGSNVAGNAKTGSGKTACYCLPTLHHLSKDPYGVFALVLTPVRELAFQVSENFRALGVGIGVSVAEVVGGREMIYQSRKIAARTHVIVATPGRLADILRGDPDLSEAFQGLRIFVLDEADKLLTQSFEEPLGEILAVIPKTRQTLLFSATITKSIERLRSRLCSDRNGRGGKELVLVDANPKDESLDNLTQQYVFVPQIVQACYLHYLLQAHFPEESCIVFAPTIDLCQLLATMLDILSFSVTGLHSLHGQRHRQACLDKFRAGRCRILVATDVASRGLDIPKVAVVINVGLPRDEDDYVHRAGRTARAGRPGLVVSLMTEEDVRHLPSIEERIGRKLELRPTNEDEALKLLSRTTKARQRTELLLSEAGFEERTAQHRAGRAPASKVRGGSNESHRRGPQGPVAQRTAME